MSSSMSCQRRYGLATLLLLLSVGPSVAGIWDDDCTNGPPAGVACTAIGNDWQTLQSSISDADDGDYIVYCPFLVQTDGTAATPTSQARFACETPGECTITGSGQLLTFKHDGAETLFYGFNFHGASDTAVRVRSESTKEQLFCKCLFEENFSSNRGGGLLIERDTVVSLTSCNFNGNSAGRGGAVYNRGSLFVSDSSFADNTANEGGGIASSSYASIEVGGSTFQNNVANEGPSLWGEADTDRLPDYFVDAGGNVMNDSLCQGFYNSGDDDTCYPFDTATVPPVTAVPSQAPVTAAPTVMTPVPSSTPSAIPTSLATTSTPSAIPTSLAATSTPSAIPTSLATTASPSLGPTTSNTVPTRSWPPVTLAIVSPTLAPASGASVTLSPATSSPTVGPTAAPFQYIPPPDPENEMLPLVSRDQKPDYYNFNILDNDYGPDAWGDLKEFENEYLKYQDDGLDVSENECGQDGIQSPIDIDYNNKQCEEFHQIRARGGDWKNLTKSGEIIFQVTPTNVRMQVDGTNPMRARADSPGGFSGDLFVDHLEITTPSLHTINGRRYDAEYTVYLPQVSKNRFLVLSVLVDASVNIYNNDFQKLLNAWARVEGCGLSKGRRLTLDDIFEDEESHDSSIPLDPRDERRLALNATIGGKFNMFSSELVPTIYWYAYEGSLVKPPCTRSANWRIYDTPMSISVSQLEQLRGILSDGPCRDDPNRQGLGESMARPIQRSHDRPLWHCIEQDFLSDCERFGLLCPAPPSPPVPQ